MYCVAGFVVANVTATDSDGTNPNNDFIYRIESGASDKFRIDFRTGVVEVEKKADLDREQVEEYTLSISAIDRGTPPLTGRCILKVNSCLTAVTKNINLHFQKTHVGLFMT